LTKTINQVYFTTTGGFLSMAKNKEKQQRQRTFKVGVGFDGIPFIRFGGKYLNRELGLTGGERLEITRADGCIILRPLSAEEIQQHETDKQIKEQQALLQKLFQRKQRLAQNY